MNTVMTPSITLAELPFIAPLLVLTVTALLVLLQAAVKRHRATSTLLTVAGLLTALAWMPFDVVGAGQAVTPLLLVDAFGLFCWSILILCGLAVTAMARGYWRASALHMEEFHVLLLCATLGACVLVVSQHFAALFIGLELMTVSLIALLGYPLAESRRETRAALEASLKYLVLSAVSSAILLFGMALLYAETGRLDFAGLLPGSMPAAGWQNLYLLLGLVMLFAGLAFKLSLVPFHLWTPDVYQGAAMPVTALLATLSKGAVLAVLMRYVQMADLGQQPLLVTALSLVAIASMLIGNLLALMQDNPKRLLAYSSIAHMGYIMLAPLVAGSFALEVVAFYLLAYVLMTLGAFAVLGMLCADAEEPQTLASLQGLIWSRPLLGAGLALMLLSLAGIPLTIGFIGKFYIVGIAVQGGLWTALAALVIGSILGLFYYLRVIVIMAQQPAHEQQGPPFADAGLSSRMLLGICCLAVILLGILPGWLLQILRNLVFAVN